MNDLSQTQPLDAVLPEVAGAVPPAPAPAAASEAPAALLDAAITRVASCSCGPETSCHRCLRVYRNQAYHEQLRRDHVLALIGQGAHSL